MIKVVGIKSCDTCRKAVSWLSKQEIDHKFHDLRVDGLEATRLFGWISAVGWETLLNQRSTTWRGLSVAEKSDITAEKAEKLMLAYPTLIKRPVFEVGRAVYVGFSDTIQAALKA